MELQGQSSGSSMFQGECVSIAINLLTCPAAERLNFYKQAARSTTLLETLKAPSERK